LDSLARKMRAGGGGVWGEVMMPAHPGITLTDAKTIINYILNSKDKTISTLPLSGSYVQKIPEGDNGKGSVVVRAAYTDRGATGANKLTTEKVVILHSPHLIPNKADVLHKTEIKKELMMSVAIKAEPKHNGHMGYKHIDLTGIKQIGFNVSANPREGFTGGTIEIRTGSATGTLIGQATVEAVDPMAAMMSAAQAMQDKGGKKDAPKKPKKQMTFDDYIAMLNKPGVMVDIKLTSGLQDLYFVFKNPKAKPLEPIVSVKDIQFNQ
jgi:cytochrome c